MYQRQNFSLPEQSIIYYIAKNISSPTVHQKLIQCCKYFYKTNPALLFHCLSYDRVYDEWNICSNIGEESCTEMAGKMCTKNWRNINFNSIQNKMWITNFLNIDCKNNFNIVSSMLVPKLHHSNVAFLEFRDQIISFNEFLLFAPSVKTLDFFDVTVKNDDNKTDATVSKLIESLPLIVKFSFLHRNNVSHISSTTVKELLEIQHFSNIKNLLLSNISEAFDIEAFFQFIKNIKTMETELYFNKHCSESYRTKLDAIVDEIIETEECDYEPPKMSYYRMEYRKRTALIIKRRICFVF